jgi:Fe-S-cluster containining protein
MTARPEVVASQAEPVRLSAGGAADDLVVGRATLILGDDALPVELQVPAQPTTVQELLPLLQQLAEVVTDRASTHSAASGQPVTCRAGCGACCRQLVPVSGVEARALAALVEEMPEPRRSTVRRRFEQAVEKLSSAGVLEDGGDTASPRERAAAYFRLGVPCPFLEDESCSIHPDRPLVCREYLVSSPSEFCSDPSPDTINKVQLEASPFKALRAIDPHGGWVPLVLSLQFAERTAPPPEVPRPAAEILREAFSNL